MQKKWNVLIVPNSPGRNVYSFEISKETLRKSTFAAAVLLLLIFLGFSYLSYGWNRSRLARIAELESGMKVRDSELAQLNREFEVLKNLEAKLRTMAGLEPREYGPVPAMGGGQGGPYSGNDDYKEPVSDLPSEVVPLQLSSRALLRDSSELKESLESVLEIFEREKARLSSIPSISPVACENSWISSGFGYRSDPLNGRKRFHEGCDIVAPSRTPVVAPADGIVSFADWSEGLGKMVEIEHGYGYTTRFGHAMQLFVNRGDVVKRGQIIAYVGSTGRSTGPHLHYEVRYHGALVNPFRYLVE